MKRTPDGRPTTTFPADLVAVAAIGLLSLIVVLARAGPVRLVLGWPLPMVLPGYALMAWLFPAGRSKELDARCLTGFERLALGIATSIGITILLGIAMNFTSVGITLATMAFGLALITMLFVVLAVNARQQVPDADRPHFVLRPARDPNAAKSHTSPGMAALLGISFAGMLIVLVLLNPFQADADAYTNLYVLGDGGSTACLPDHYTAGTGFGATPEGAATCPPTTGRVTVGIVNHEKIPVTYFVKVFWSAPTPSDLQDSVSTGNIETFSAPLGPLGAPSDKIAFETQYQHVVALTPPPSLGALRLNIQLFKDLGHGVSATPDQFVYFYVNST